MNEWVWSNGGMILTGENWSAGRKTLYGVGGRCVNVYGTMVEWYWWENWIPGRKTFYSVGGRVMNEYGTMVEWYWQGKPEMLGEKHYTAWVVDWWMCMEQWWNDTDGKTEVLGEKQYRVWVVDEWYRAMVEWYWQGKNEVRGKNIIERGW